ncbi:MAG TPA: hypothetical protein VI300_01490, partial [Solirubrobacter sp.]
MQGAIGDAGDASGPPYPFVYFAHGAADQRVIEPGGMVRGSDRASRIDWVIRQCRLLNTIGDEFERTRPF